MSAARCELPCLDPPEAGRLGGADEPCVCDLGRVSERAAVCAEAPA